MEIITDHNYIKVLEENKKLIMKITRLEKKIKRLEAKQPEYLTVQQYADRKCLDRNAVYAKIREGIIAKDGPGGKSIDWEKFKDVVFIKNTRRNKD